MFLELALIILAFALIFLLFLLYQQKQKEKSHSHQLSTLTQLQEQKISSLSTSLTNSTQEIQTLKELILTNFADHKSSLRERFDYLDKSFAELNKIFMSSKRGMLGNSYLNELLGIILPRDDSVYQLEYTLTKKTEEGKSLRVDAIVFGSEKKNNLAIDSKFPLDNYLVMSDESRSVEEREQAQKDFQQDLKRHKEVNKTFSAAVKKIGDLETTVGKILEKNEKLKA